MANSYLDKTGLAYLWQKIVALVGTKQDTLTFDTTPTASSTNPVTSGGVKTALDGKQATLTFDSSPTQNSSNPVTSGGVYTALSGKAASDHTQAVNKGGTNITSYTTGDILYAFSEYDF